ncbi:MAG: mandelate racemase/muconate lactonizing enzyme family protein, partial [Halobacteriaceae archaeon]
MDDEEYIIPEGGGVPWRDLGKSSSRRSEDRDVRIEEIETAAIQGNFTWGLVRIQTNTDVEGLGETFLGEESLDIVNRFSSLLIGENPLDVRRLMAHLEQERPAPGSIGRAAIAGIEIALLDIKGKVLDVPVYELLGGKFRDDVRVYCDVHAGESLGVAQNQHQGEVYTPDAYAAAARRAADQGFSALKFDLDIPMRQEVDTAARRLDNEAIEHKVMLVTAVRDEIGDEMDLGVDLHWNYTVETAVRLIERLEKLDLAWVEDPCPPRRAEAHRRVTRGSTTPILTGVNL